MTALRNINSAIFSSTRRFSGKTLLKIASLSPEQRQTYIETHITE